MADTTGYQVVTPSGSSPKAAPGTEKTNEGQAKPGPGWAKGDK